MRGLLAIFVISFGYGCSCGGASGGDVDAGFGGDGAVAIDAGPSVDAADDCTGGALCGQPATCCPAGNDCVEGMCLAACATGIRCGADFATCCDAGDVCLSAMCVTPGNSCQDSYDCQQPGEFCEPTLGQCLPQPDPLTCEFEPSFSELDVTVEWMAPAEQIISIPVVADIDGDGFPEVVINITQQDGLSWPGGNIVVLDGTSGIEQTRIPHDIANDQYGSHGRATIALGDVSGDGVPDIVYATREITTNSSFIVAVDAAGNLLWKSHDALGMDETFNVENAAITLANFDSDPMAEVVVGGTLIDHDGLVVWNQGGDGPNFGTNGGYRGGISAVADLDDDNIPEIVSGKHAWKVDWQAGPTVVVTPYWTYTGADGYPAVVDLDGNGVPEVVLVASSNVIALNGQSGLLWCGVDPSDAMCVTTPALRTPPLAIPGGTSSNRGGPPTIADFDADGRPEIGIAGGYAYSVYDINRTGEDIVQPIGDPAPAAGALFVRWSEATQDLSSNATGSSVFDFQGDGAAEVVYADECFMRVYSGTDGTVQLELPNSSATIHEYPLVVDVDADGNSEILIVANDKVCTGQTPRFGLYVYGDVNDEWVPTRRVWTQHSYHVTNATSAGNVPMVEPDNWTTAGLNNYRQNVQGDGVFNAPDLTVGLSVSLAACGQGMVELRARVSNQGALGVPMGVVVDFYQGTDATGTALGSATTTAPLLPGQSETVSITVAAPAAATDYFAVVDGSAAVTVAECNGDNNTDLTTQAGCPVVD